MSETQTEYKTQIQREENGGSRYLQTRVLSQRPLIRAYLGDCMDWMRVTADKAYDLAIVDPPYGIGSGIRKASGKNIPCMDGADTRFNPKAWDKKIPNNDYFLMLRRISNNQIIWGGNYFQLPISRGWIFWDKKPIIPNYSDGELAWTSFDIVLKRIEILWNGKIRTGIEPGYKSIHPTQKPIALYRWLLQNYAKAGQRIFDSHGGSFSSAIACYMEGFDLDICEIDEEYFESAIKRFKQATQQIHLFHERLL